MSIIYSHNINLPWFFFSLSPKLRVDERRLTRLRSLIEPRSRDRILPYCKSIDFPPALKLAAALLTASNFEARERGECCAVLQRALLCSDDSIRGQTRSQSLIAFVAKIRKILWACHWKGGGGYIKREYSTWCRLAFTSGKILLLCRLLICHIFFSKGKLYFDTLRKVICNHYFSCYLLHFY